MLERNPTYPDWGQHPAATNPPVGAQVLERLAASLLLPGRAERGPVKTSGKGEGADPSLQTAYSICTDIIRQHSKSFYFSARLLPSQKRKGIMALYAFCRTSDDLVDAADRDGDREQARDASRASLESWAELIRDAEKNSHHPVARAWADTRQRYSIPVELADELLAGVRMDLTIDRYDTWEELWLYCYRVASTVGLMSMYVTGAERIEAVPYAVQLGIALQLTNILRDVGEDARSGRIYLPAEDMERFGYSEEMALESAINSSFVNLMEFQISRARALYESALPGIALLPRDSRLAVTAAASVYRGILTKIEAARYDVFNRRAHLSTGEKLRALPAIWWTSRRENWKDSAQIVRG